MHRVCFKLPKQLGETEARVLAEGLVDLSLSSATMRESHAQDALWVIEWLTEDEPVLMDIIARLSLQAAAHNIHDVIEISPDYIDIEELPDDEDWLKKAYQSLDPLSIGQFFVYDSQYKGDVPEDKIALLVEASTAFGSGEHETTKGCIQAMLDLKAKGACPWNILDMGTGSGILALIAWKLWKSPILGVDNQAESIRVTKRHAEMNGVKIGNYCLSVAVGDGFNTPLVGKNKPYELILANILAGPIIEMAPALVDVLDDNGYCVLSGMLTDQSDLVLSAYEGEGLTYRSRYDIGEWTTLVMQKTQSYMA